MCSHHIYTYSSACAWNQGLQTSCGLFQLANLFLIGSIVGMVRHSLLTEKQIGIRIRTLPNLYAAYRLHALCTLRMPNN